MASIVEIPELNSTENKSNRDKLSENGISLVQGGIRAYMRQ